jgi:hypothetical protein
MDRVKIDLKHCYGIKSLQHVFDFSDVSAYAIYAPNGAMKSSFAHTFKDLSSGSAPSDLIFPTRKTTCKIIDENGSPVDHNHILVVEPYDEKLVPSEKTSLLLVNHTLRTEHTRLRSDIEQARLTLIGLLKKQASTKIDIGAEISNAIMRRPNAFEMAMGRIRAEVQDLKETPFANIKYDTIFNANVISALNDEGVKGLVDAYTKQYNMLLENSVFFKKGTFDYYNAGEIAKSLTKHGFFKAKHSVRLNSTGAVKEVADRKELEIIIEEEKNAIIADPNLRKVFDAVFNRINKNEGLREFADYVSQPDNAAILSRLDNIEAFRQDVFMSYIKANEDAYLDLIQKIEVASVKYAEIEAAAAREHTRWQTVIEIFRDRFIVPFRLEATNTIDMILGRQLTPELRFTYTDGADEIHVEHEEVLKALSTGEKKALYILNVIFEIETRRQSKQETLVIVDDVADSFGYQNKYAIIHYLKEISEDGYLKR